MHFGHPVDVDDGLRGLAGLVRLRPGAVTLGTSASDANHRGHRLRMFDRVAHAQITTPRMAYHDPGADTDRLRGCPQDQRLPLPWCAGRRPSGQRRAVRGTRRGGPAVRSRRVPGTAHNQVRRSGRRRQARGRSHQRATRHRRPESSATPCPRTLQQPRPPAPPCRHDRFTGVTTLTRWPPGATAAGPPVRRRPLRTEESSRRRRGETWAAARQM